ncbi:vacuolar protein sorting-associated protein 37A-like [Branchiostoma floridae x Branchiostoma belcheri]
MFNLFGRSKPQSNLPAPTALQQQRHKQIETLKTFNQNVFELRRDVEYRVTCSVNNVTISLNIQLPPEFPKDRPIVVVSPPLRHPWVNDQMVITGCPGINSFAVHTDLGRVIRTIIDEFKNNPPQILAPASSSGQLPYPAHPPQYMGANSPYPTTSYPSSTSSYMPQVPMPTLPSTSTTTTPTPRPEVRVQGNFSPVPFKYKMPDIPESFNEVNSLSVAELKELHDNETKVVDLFSSLPQCQQLYQDRDKLNDATEELARQNLDKQPMLEQKKKELIEKVEEQNELRRMFDKSSQRQNDLMDQFKPGMIQANLKVAAQQAEEESDVIADEFLEGKMEIDEFLQKFMEKRVLCHIRHAKEEKYQQMMANRPLRSTMTM